MSAASPSSTAAASVDLSVNLSAKAQSQKNVAELAAVRADRARRPRDSVNNIVEKMNERGIGGVDLAGHVEVEAFAHDAEQARRLELEARAAALREAEEEEKEREAAATEEEAKRRAAAEETKKKFERGGSGGGGSGTARDYLEQAYQSAGGGGGRRSSGGGSVRGVDAAADGFEVVREESGRQYGSALKPVPDDARKGGVVGVYKERAGGDAGDKGGPSETSAGVLSEPPQSKSDLVARYDASGRGVEVDGLHSEAYAMNASKYDAAFKQQRAQGVVPGEPAPQKDVDEVVADMAERQANAQDPADGEVAVPQRDAAAEEYDRRLKAELSAAKEEAGPAPDVPMKDKPPSEDEELMTEKPEASEAAPDGATEVEEVVLELEEGGEGPDPAGSEDEEDAQDEAGSAEKEAALEEDAAAARRVEEEEAEQKKAEEEAAEEELPVALEAEVAAAKQAEEEEAARRKAEEEESVTGVDERQVEGREVDTMPAKPRAVPAVEEMQDEGKGGCGCVIS